MTAPDSDIASHQPSRMGRMRPVPVSLYLDDGDIARLRAMVLHDRYGSLDELVSLMVRIVLLKSHPGRFPSMAELDLRVRILDAQLEGDL